jgi:nucleotide-binding universal stress UspA family protein
MRSDEGAYLRNRADRVSTEAGVVATPVVLEGPPATTLIGYANARAPQLVVMTTRGRGSVGRLFLGGVADRLIRGLHYPILLVHAGRAIPTLRPDGRRHILVPLDGSTLAESVLDQVLAVFSRDEVVLELLRVVPQFPGLPLYVDAAPSQAGQEQQTLLAANQYLHAVAVHLGKLGVQIHAEVQVAPSVADAILTYAEAHRSDVIAVATHGSGGVERMLLGSVADKLVRGARVPLLVWNPPPGASSQVLAAARASAEPAPAMAAHH